MLLPARSCFFAAHKSKHLLFFYVLLRAWSLRVSVHETLWRHLSPLSRKITLKGAVLYSVASLLEKMQQAICLLFFNLTSSVYVKYNFLLFLEFFF